MGAMTTIKIPVEDGTSLPAYLARPATTAAPTGVIVVHELFGVNPDIRGVTDDLAAAGYLATPRISGLTPNSSCATITPVAAGVAAGRAR